MTQSEDKQTEDKDVITDYSEYTTKCPEDICIPCGSLIIGPGKRIDTSKIL